MAGRIPDTFIDELRSRSDIVDVLSGYMHLTQKGSRFWGLCPFHGEKTPSFSVDRQRQSYYCFGCHTGGNVYTFLMEQEHLSFVEAVELLAQRAGMQVPHAGGAPESSAAKQLRARAQEACTCAARFFHAQLNGPQGDAARAYLEKREISPSAVRRFGIGYAPQGWDVLFEHLKEQGFTPGEITAAGLAVEKNGKFYDMFRQRVMFPIFSPRGEVIAFGGRIMTDGQPKYLNSSDTVVFNKRRNLYGLSLCKNLKAKTLHLVEGYIDVVSLVSHGVQGCVATLGTAITAEQAQLLKRYTSHVTICYDGDEAGQKATERALQIFEFAGMQTDVCIIPNRQDPDDFVKANGAQAFLALQRMTGTAFLLGRAKAQLDLSLPDQRTQYAIAASKILKPITEPVVLEGYLRQLMVDTGFSREVLLEQIGRSAPAPSPASDIKPAVKIHNIGKNALMPDYVRAQRALLSVLGTGLEVPPGLISQEDFTDEDCIRIAKVLWPRLGSKSLAADVLTAFEDDEAMRNTAAQIFQEHDASLSAQQQAMMVRQYVDVIRRHRLTQQIEQIQKTLPQMAPDAARGALEQIAVLQKQLDQLRRRG